MFILVGMGRKHEGSINPLSRETIVRYMESLW